MPKNSWDDPSIAGVKLKKMCKERILADLGIFAGYLQGSWENTSLVKVQRKTNEKQQNKSLKKIHRELCFPYLM